MAFEAEDHKLQIISRYPARFPGDLSGSSWDHFATAASDIDWRQNLIDKKLPTD